MCPAPQRRWQQQVQRPAKWFRFFDKRLSLVGAVLCGVIMIAINPIAGAAAMALTGVVTLILIALIGFGDAREGAWFDKHGFTSNVAEFQESVAAVERFDGGDPVGGSVVFTSSGSALFGAQSGQHYGATKAALLSMTKAIATAAAMAAAAATVALPQATAAVCDCCEELLHGR